MDTSQPPDGKRPRRRRWLGEGDVQEPVREVLSKEEDFASKIVLNVFFKNEDAKGADQEYLRPYKP